MADQPKAKKGKVKAYKAGRACPKCGAGTKLGAHKDRFSCGKCGYMETRSATA